MELSSFMQFFQDIIGNGISDLAELVTSVLPLSPFQSYIEYFENLPYIGWINWFMPVRGYLIVWASWLSAVALYYIYAAILRWIKAIE